MLKRVYATGLLLSTCVALLTAQASLTPTQVATLKTDITASGDAAPLCSAGNLQGVADLYNATASPDFWVWRTSVSKDELVGSVSVDSTTFNWTGAGYITRTQGERDAFNAIFSTAGTVDPSQANVRQAFADIFSGATAPAPANRTHLLAVARRKATRLEKLFASGTGSTASPALMAVQGLLAYTTLIGQCP